MLKKISSFIALTAALALFFSCSFMNLKKDYSKKTNAILFETELNTIDDQDDIFFFFIPPDRDIKPVILDFELDQINNPDPNKPIINLANYKEHLKNFIPENYIFFKQEGYIRYNKIGKVLVKGNLIRESFKEFRIKRIRIALDFQKSYKNNIKIPDTVFSKDSSYSNVLSKLVMNYPEREIYADPEPPVSKDVNIGKWTPMSFPANEQHWVKITTEEEGFVCLGYDDLINAKFDTRKCSPENLHIFNYEGKEVPVFIDGPISDSFTEQNHIIFYKEKLDSLFSAKNVYWMKYDKSTKALLMKENNAESGKDTAASANNSVDYFNEKIRIEEENSLEIDSGNFLSIKGMDWVSGLISDTEPYSMNFDLPDYYKEIDKRQNAEITFKLFPISEDFNPGCSVRISLNNSNPISLSIDNPLSDTIKMSFPAGLLTETGNVFNFSIKAANNKPVSKIFFNYAELIYPKKIKYKDSGITFLTNTNQNSGARYFRIADCSKNNILSFDVSDTKNPVFLKTTPPLNNVETLKIVSGGIRKISLLDTATYSDKKYVVQKIKQDTDILFKTNEGADYIIIYHEDLFTALNPLIQLKESQGLKVVTADIETIYDKYSGGIPTPHAIKSFLNDAFRNWSNPKPVYVLLVGDCTSDYKGIAKNDVRNFVPSYEVVVEKTSEEGNWTSDQWFTDIAGDDAYQDLLIGRISTNNLKNTESVVEKIVRYQKDTSKQQWQNRIGFVSDDGPFEKEISKLIKYDIPSDYDINFVQLSNMPWEDNIYLPTAVVEEEKSKISPATTKAILDMFNNGTSLIWYFGHGSPNIWADERIWFGGDSENSDNLLLKNYNSLPFIFNMTCNSGAIDYPVPRWNICITEDMMRVTNGGAVGVYAPSGPGYSTSHFIFSKYICESLFRNNFRSIGEIILFGQSKFIGDTEKQDIPMMYILMGDPSLQINLLNDKLEVTGDKNYLQYGQKNTINLNIKTPDISKGKLFLHLSSPQFGKITYEKEISITSENTLIPIDLPADSIPGKWHAQIYAISENNYYQKNGVFEFTIDSPNVSINTFVRSNNDYPTPENPVSKAYIEIVNSSLIPVENIPLTIMRGNDKVFEKTLSFKPEEKILQEISLPLKQELNVFKAAITLPKAEFLPTDEIIDSANLVIPLCSTTEKGDLAISFQEISWQVLHTDNKLSIEVNIPVYNIGNKQITKFVSRATDINNNLRVNGTQIHSSLSPNGKKDIKYTFSLSALNESTNVFKFNLFPTEDPEDPTPQNNDYILTLTPDMITNISIDPLFIKIEPEKLIEGSSIFISAKIRNNSKLPARNILIGLYPKDPNLSPDAKPLESMVDNKDNIIKYLAPGKEIIKKFRWDPMTSEKLNTVYISVNPKHDFMEQSYNDNTKKVDLNVSKKGELKPIDIKILEQSQEMKNQNIAYLRVRFVNDGETPLQKVNVVYYSNKEQTKENEIGRILVEEVKPHEEVSKDIKWNYTPGVKYQPSFQLFIKGSSRRISGN